MAAASITNTFTATTAAVASQVNRNFTDLVDFANDDTVHRDGSKPFTADMSMGSNKITNVTSGTADNDAVNVGQLSAAVATGIISMYGGTTAPTGWLLCNGALVSRTGYADLFAVIGTSFGIGDGSTTFALPNFTDKFPYGDLTPGTTGGSNDAVNIAHTHTMGTHTHTSAAHSHTMPSHTHSIDHNHGSATTATDGAHSHTYIESGYGADSNVATGTTKNALTTAGFASYPRGVTDVGSDHSHSFNMPNFTGTSGSKDPGDTNSKTPGATGATDPGDTNSSGVSGTNLNRPAFVGVNFIIKSGL